VEASCWATEVPDNSLIAGVIVDVPIVADVTTAYIELSGASIVPDPTTASLAFHWRRKSIKISMAKMKANGRHTIKKEIIPAGLEKKIQIVPKAEVSLGLFYRI
jgi:hypothetical protein